MCNMTAVLSENNPVLSDYSLDVMLFCFSGQMDLVQFLDFLDSRTGKRKKEYSVFPTFPVFISFTWFLDKCWVGIETLLGFRYRSRKVTDEYNLSLFTLSVFHKQTPSFLFEKILKLSDNKVTAS